MHILIALAGLAITAFIYIQRMRRTSDVAGDLMSAAADVKNAARRFGFRRQAGLHPVESIDDPNLAIGALATAFLELDDLPTADARTRTEIALRKHLSLDTDAASEVMVLGHWFVTECGGPTPGFERLSRKLRRIDGAQSFEPLMAVLADVTLATGGTPSTRQAEALEDLARVFRLT